jgi:hypothetical protein
MKERYEQLVHYVRKAAGLPSSRYLQSHDFPVLLWPQGKDWTEDTTLQFETYSGEFNNEKPTEIPAENESQVNETLVMEVRKRVSSSPTNMICVGRATNNDLVLYNSTVSKLHAYFVKTAGADTLEIVDANSTNGTRVNRKRLTPYQVHPLSNRDHIQFGPYIQAMYLTARGFYELLQQLHRVGII